MRQIEMAGIGRSGRHEEVVRTARHGEIRTGRRHGAPAETVNMTKRRSTP
jgi:hypothetical protein